jgi:hypothetical protein
LVNFVWENLFLEFEEKIFKNSLIFFRTLLHSLLQNKRYTRLSADLETIHAYLVKGNKVYHFYQRLNRSSEEELGQKIGYILGK